MPANLCVGAQSERGRIDWSLVARDTARVFGGGLLYLHFLTLFVCVSMCRAREAEMNDPKWLEMTHAYILKYIKVRFSLYVSMSVSVSILVFFGCIKAKCLPHEIVTMHSGNAVL